MAIVCYFLVHNARSAVQAEDVTLTYGQRCATNTCMKAQLLLLITLAASISLALDPAPVNQIDCSAAAFEQTSTIPLQSLQPFAFSLLPNATTQHWTRTFEKIQVTPKFQKFYSAYWISPESLIPFAKSIVENRTALTNGNVEFVLSRFAQTWNRVAGLSLQFNVARGFFGSFLLDKVQDGSFKKIQAPFDLDDGKGMLSIDCQIRD
jgi:hypothetical protein